jgi:hypothetical protein
MSGSMFVGDHILMDVCLDSAMRQLERLAQDGVLLGASEHAYGEGITGLVETTGLAVGVSRLAGVRPGELMATEGCARLWLRWEAIGSDGTLFPALDADLTLSPAGENTTVLTLAGVYRLPEHAGARLEPGIVRCFAAVTIDSFIARLACALMHPAGSAVPAAYPQAFPRERSGCPLQRPRSAAIARDGRREPDPLVCHRGTGKTPVMLEQHHCE